MVGSIVRRNLLGLIVMVTRTVAVPLASIRTAFGDTE